MASLPSAIKAVLIERHGGPEVLRYTTNLALPIPQRAEGLVRTEYSGINFIDTYFRSGLYPAPQLPLVLGYEGVGELIAMIGDLAEDQDLQIHDTVIWIGQGTYSEYCSVPLDRLIKVPAGISPKIAVGSFLMGITALALVEESYKVRKGDVILVHAAAGGVGLLLCQLIKHAGATVIGTASTQEKCDIALAHGAAHMVNYTQTTHWVSEVKKLVPDGVHCVYDGVGKTTWQGSLDIVRRKGSVVFFGSASGPPPPLDIQILGKKVIKICRAVVFQYIVTRAELEYYASLLFRHLHDNTLKVNIHKVYSLEDIRQSHLDLENRVTNGKLLVATRA